MKIWGNVVQNIRQMQYENTGKCSMINKIYRAYISGIEHVSVGGETGREARVCDYDWVLDIREQCLKAGVTFWFKNTGSVFKRDGVIQKVNPYKQNSVAKELGINILGDKKLY